MIETLAPLRKDSRRHRVAEILRHEIVSGRLAPGARLREGDLAEQLGTSRAPVREALRQLEQEGLVISYPYRGTEVLGVTEEEVREVLIPVRLTLESFALKHALAEVEPPFFNELESVVASMQEAADGADLDLLSAADIRFHQTVIEASGHEHSRQLWHLIQPRVWAYFRRDASRHSSAHDVVRQHRDLLAVWRGGDVDSAVEALSRHLTDLPG